MKSNPSNQAPESSSINLVTVGDDRKVITTSVMVAEYFGKQHYNVMRDIEALKEKCPLNFEGANYLDKQKKERPMYKMDRTGFTLLAMGFTGKKALDFKIRYIQAFDAMEQELINQSGGYVAVPAGPVRVCGSCGKEKPLSAFYKNRSTRDGYAWECKECAKLFKKKIFDRNAGHHVPAGSGFPSMICLSCGHEKPVTDFYIDPATPSGRSASCKVCVQSERQTFVPRVHALPAPEPEHDTGRDQLKVDMAMVLVEHWKLVVTSLRDEVDYYRRELRKCEGREPY